MKNEIDFPTIAILAVIGVSIAILSSIGVFGGLQAAGLELRTGVAAPFQPTFAVVRDALQVLPRLQAVKLESETLRAQVLDKQILQDKLIELQSENEFLRSQLQLEVPITSSQQLVKVISYSYSPSVGVVFVRTENTFALYEGDWVAHSGYLVGRITEVFGEYARVAMISSDEINVAVRIGSGNEFAQMQGREGLRIDLLDVDKSSNVKKDDPVRLLNPDNLELKGFLLGYVDSVTGLEASENFEVTMRTPIDLGNLEYLLLVHKDA